MSSSAMWRMVLIVFSGPAIRKMIILICLHKMYIGKIRNRGK